MPKQINSMIALFVFSLAAVTVGPEEAWRTSSSSSKTR